MTAFRLPIYLLAGMLALQVASLADVTARSAPFAMEPYTWKNVHIGGGGFVTGILFHPKQRGLAYVRTDVGGAYRWDASANRWAQLTDFLGLADANLTGIESLAIDPRDPSRIYLAAGTYTHPQVGNGAMLLSADQGRTFTRVDMPFKMGGNEAGRGNGERLVVDPHDGRILFFGSRADGLWRSADAGHNWSRVEGFPALATSPSSRDGDRRNQPVGIVWLLFDPRRGHENEPTRTIYAAISTREGGLHRSNDAGATWEKLPGQPLGLRSTRAALAPDGRLFLAFGNDPGPNTMTDGALWIYDPGNGNAWTDITPLRSDKKPLTGFGYGAVALDPSNPQIVVATTFCRWEPEDEIFLSHDGGRNWRPLIEQSQWDFHRSPWARHHSAHWIADFKIDPFDPDHALFTTGFGLWASRNLSAAANDDATVTWWFKNEGLEETVPLGLISPPEGAPLISALGDLDGFKHEQLDQAPLQFAGPPRFANSESIAFAGQRPAYLVRVGTIRNRTTQIRGAYSQDGGDTWTPFDSEPPGNGGGTVTITAEGKTIVWTPWNGRAHFTRDRGKTWLACAGVGDGTPVVADRVDPRLLYAFDRSRGSILSSVDGGRNFIAHATGLPGNAGARGGFGGGGAPDVTLHSSPDGAGVIWLSSRNQGLMVSTDAGETFQKIPAVVHAYSLGFGKAAPGHDASALYLFGKVAETTGLFRSIDSGATWTRINDDMHQFGWLNHVTGDPRVYGRIYFGTGGRGIFYGEPAR
jgi:photosystem II stability/assembly factor-like uncharacterized protein